MLTRARVRNNQGETGSVAVTMVVLMVVALLSVGVIARTLASQGQVRRNQDFNSGLASADAGVSDALFQLDQGQSATFTNSGTSGGGTFSYTATRIDDSTYKVQSKGTVNGVAHQVVATASRDLRFDYALFSVQSIDFNGNCSGDPVGAVGSGGSITTNGNGVCALRYDCYLPGHGPCPATSQNGHILNQTDPQPDPVVPAVTQACPAGGVFPAVINGSGGTPFLCSSGASFQSVTTVTNGPVIIYVTGGTVDPGCDSINSGGTAVNFQLYVTPSETWKWNGSCQTTITAGIYAPHANITVDGGKLSLTGALVASQLTINGTPNSAFVDPTLNSVVITNWRISGYHEVSSTCVSNC